MKKREEGFVRTHFCRSITPLPAPPSFLVFLSLLSHPSRFILGLCGSKGIIMSDQDWAPVVIRKKKASASQARSKQVSCFGCGAVQAQRDKNTTHQRSM